jgi:SecD/SecF fusion protein
MKGKIFGKVGIIILVAVILGILNMPPDMKAPLVSWAPDYIKNQKLHLGLDLQGGAELDYKIDLRKVPMEDRQSIVEGVREVINRRVNNLGVSEPNIYISKIADEHHIIVDLAGVNIEEAKSTIGKTIQLEFKERKETIDPNEKQKIESQANEALQRIKEGDEFAVVGQEEEQANPELVTYTESDWKFKDQINASIAENLFELSPGEVHEGTIESKGEYTVTPEGEFVEMTSVNIVKLLEKQEVERTKSIDKKVEVKHILVAYEGAERADESITRTKEEARQRAEEVMQKLNDNGEFEELAKEYSDDPGSKETGGVLASPAGEGKYAEAFESAALALEEDGELSDIVETEFGFHIIQADIIHPAEETTADETQVKYAKISFSTVPSAWQETQLTGEHFVHADVEFNQVYQPYVAIQFNDEGSQLFAEITERNQGKPLAIFVGGELISAPNVRQKITGGQAIIEGNFSIEEASDLARDLNTGAIPAPIVLAGQYTIGSELGNDALMQSLWAGVIGLIILAVYMIAYYRMQGVMAIIALCVYAVTLIFLIQSKLHTFLAVLIAVTMFVYLMVRILNSKDKSWEKLLTSVLAVFALFFIVFLLANPIVLTLAGVAGVILSIGMAVDANILIFERIKEEVRNGRPYGSAIDIGFDRAWHSIRDSNFSSLITCAILFYFGSSIIQGFAFNLAAGILVSMFTAITVTKNLLKMFVGTSISEKYLLLGAKPGQKKRKPFEIIKNSKKWFIFSGAITLIALVSVLSFGLKLGIDFSGGTLMQVKFEQEVQKDELKTELEKIGREISENGIEEPAAEEVIEESTEAQVAETSDEEPQKEPVIKELDKEIDLSTASVIWSSDGYIIKTKYMPSDVHEVILNKLEQKFGPLEEPRFTTVGPTVGETMKAKATIALLIALVAIVFYIAFAFRKIPRQVSPWRFGLSAIVALAHDVLIVVGIYAILGQVLGVEIDALFITALLTILGFSVHDTIVVFDRVRENLKNLSRDTTFAEVANRALNQTMARSINTSLSTLFTLVALLLLGGASIYYFVLALVIGTIVGTYSSIFVASPVLVWWNTRAHKKKQY